MRTIQFGALRPAEFYLEAERHGQKNERKIHIERPPDAYMIDEYNKLLCGDGPLKDRLPSLQDRDFQADPKLTFTLIDGKPVLATGKDAINTLRYDMQKQFGEALGRNVLPSNLAHATRPTSDQVQTENPVQVKLRLVNEHAAMPHRIVDIIG